MSTSTQATARTQKTSGELLSHSSEVSALVRVLFYPVEI